MKSYKDLLSHYKNKAISCKKCHETAIPVVYGLPGAELSKAAAAGAVMLAGCMVPERRAKYYCVKCKDYIY